MDQQHLFFRSLASHRACCAAIVASVSAVCIRMELSSAISSAVFLSARQQERAEMVIARSQECMKSPLGIKFWLYI